MVRSSCHRLRSGAAALALVIVMVVFGLLPAYATSGSTDDELLADAYAAYGAGDWLKAALLFSAYFDRSPLLLQVDAQQRENIDACYTYARSQLENGLVAASDLPKVQQELFDTRVDLSRCQTGVGPGASWGRVPPPAPPTPMPLPRAAASRRPLPLVCRGGGAMQFGYEPVSKAAARPEVWIRFDRAPLGVGKDREYIGSLQPGQCAWLDGPVSWSEPDEIHLRPPLFRPEQFRLVWTADKVEPGADVGSLNRMTSPTYYTTYYAYDDGQGSLVATGYQACTPGPEQVKLFVDTGYRPEASCSLAGIGNYFWLSEIGLQDNSISSIMVAADVRAYLCSDANLAGKCAFFATDDAGLSNEFGSNDQVSSLRVERRDDCEPKPDEVGLFMDYKFGPPCERKSIGRYNSYLEIGLPDRSISSVRVGKDATLTLCQDKDLAGPCEDFTSDDYDLSDNFIGDNRVSSMEVR